MSDTESLASDKIRRPGRPDFKGGVTSSFGIIRKEPLRSTTVVAHIWNAFSASRDDQEDYPPRTVSIALTVTPADT